MLVSTVTDFSGSRLTTHTPLQGMRRLHFRHAGETTAQATLLPKLRAASTAMPSRAIQQKGFKAYIALFPTQFSISWEYIPDY